MVNLQLVFYFLSAFADILTVRCQPHHKQLLYTID